MIESENCESGRVELVNGRFVDVEKGKYHPDGTRLILRQGRIESVLGPGDAPLHPPDETIDLQGLCATPGLFNTHCHLQLKVPGMLMGMTEIYLTRKYRQEQIRKSLHDCMEYGVTTIRDVATEDIRDNRALQREIEEGTLLGPRILQAILVCMAGSCWDTFRGWSGRIFHYLAGVPFLDFSQSFPYAGVITFPPDADGKQVRDCVDQAVEERNADLIKIYEQREERITYKEGAPLMSWEQLEALVDQTRHHDLPSTVHQLTREVFLRAVRAGVRSLAHLPFDQLLDDEDIEAFIEEGGYIEPTVSIAYGLCWPLDDNPHQDHPFMKTLEEHRNATQDDLMERFWLEPLAKGAIRNLNIAAGKKVKVAGMFDMAAPFRYHFNLATYGRENLHRLFQAGATLGCGNDAGVPPHTEGMMGHELEMMDLFLNSIEGGDRKYDSAEALRVATIHSARCLGVDGDLGTLEEGKWADIALWNGDVLDDYRRLKRPVAALFKEGKLVIDHCGLRGEKEGTGPEETV